MTVNLNFNLEAWIKQLQIEDVSSEEEAKEKLMSMSLSEIFSDESFTASDCDITEVTTEVVDYTAVVNVSDIQYYFDSDEIGPAVIDYLKAKLPKEKILTIDHISVDEDLEETIKDELSLITGYEIESITYELVERK
jgi:hypothetical protein